MDVVRGALTLGAVAAAGGTAFTALAPTDWMAAQLAIADGDEAATFLLRRFAASATAGLGVTAVAALRGAPAPTAALAGLSTWFAVQALTAWTGLATGTVGGVARFSAVFDPAMAAAFALAARRSGHDHI